MMEGNDRENFISPMDLGDLPEQAPSSTSQDKNSSEIMWDIGLEQSKCDVNASKMHALVQHSVQVCINQEEKLLCKEHGLSHSPEMEVQHDALNAYQEVCSNLEEPEIVVCARSVQSDGRKTVGAEIRAIKFDEGTLQLNTIESSAAEEQKLGCIKDSEEGKLIEVGRRRSSRIKKLVKIREEEISTLSMGTGPCTEKEDPKLVVANSVEKIWDNDSISTQNDFFLPVSKRSKKQIKSEEKNTVVSNGEKRQRDGKLGLSQKGNSATNNEDFFIPASKKQKQMLIIPDSMMKEELEEKTSIFQFDLWTEAKLAAEENAQLWVGKPTHPFFSQHRGGQRASLSLGIPANVCSSHLAAYSEEGELIPSPPFHITQLMEAEVGTTDMMSWTSSEFLQNLKVNQTFSSRECLDLMSKELDSLLRIPTVDKLSVATRRNYASRVTSLDNALEPLLSFLKDSESISKDQNVTEKEECDFSLTCLKERLNSFASNHSKGCSHDSCDMMSSSTDEGNTSKNLLWTNVYQPQSPKEVCGNMESVNHLSAWLERWQAGGAMTTGLSNGDTIRRKISNNEDSDEDQGCFQEDSNSDGETREETTLQNVLFLAGPVGCGKTAAIYACARVHGYTVIEVSCSDNRNGSMIKQKFSESMESHRVGTWSADMIGPGTAPFSAKRVVSTPADFNMTKSSHVTELRKTRQLSKEKRQKQKEKQNRKDHDITQTQTSKVPNRAALNTDVGLALEAKQFDESSECNKSMTVLLFEDVDMVFEDDRGFMAAVVQVAATAKRPIILTSNDKRLCLPQSLGAELLEFKRPSTRELVVLAYLVCVAEGIPCRPEFLQQMVKMCHNDLRTLLNYLQFWFQGRINESSAEHQKNVAKIEKGAKIWPDLRSEEAESASVTKLFKLEAQHRLWPSYVSLSFPCHVTQLVACKLNDMVSQVERKFDNDEEKKLENRIIEKLVLLKKLKRQKVDSPSHQTGELSDSTETPVKNLKEAKTVARSPILREKLKKDLAAAMLGFTDDAQYKECCDEAVLQRSTKQGSVESENHSECLNTHLSETCDSNGAIPDIAASPIKNARTADITHMLVKQHEVCGEPNAITADFKVEPTPTELTTESNLLLALEDLPPLGLGNNPLDSILQNIFEPIDTLWSEFRNTKEKQGLVLSSASKESYKMTLSLSELSDNLSSSDVMSCGRGPGKMFLEDDMCCWESPEDSSMFQACSMFAHRSLMLCIQECSMMRNLPEEIRPTITIEDMMLAVNDLCAVGKLFTHDEAFSSRGVQLQSVTVSHQEQDFERYRKKSSLQHALSSELPLKAQVSFQGASFFEYASFLARIGHLEQDRLTSGAVRRRGRGFQNYFRSHPWNLSKESINILEQFGRFSTS